MRRMSKNFAASQQRSLNVDLGPSASSEHSFVFKPGEIRVVEWVKTIEPGVQLFGTFGSGYIFAMRLFVRNFDVWVN